MHVSSAVSPLDSPQEGFRLPQWTPLTRDASIDDFAAAATEPLSRVSALSSASEACTLTGISESLSSSSYGLAKDTAVEASQCLRSSLCRSFSRHCLSKLGSRRLFGRQKLDDVTCLRSVGRQNQALFLENGQNLHEPGSQSEGNDSKQQMTLSQLVASSTREVFGWSDVNSVSQLSWTLDEDGTNAFMPLPFERIRADFSQPDEDSGALESDDVLEKCALCSLGLLHKSPWSAQRYVGSNDLPVVGVLVCGHVFHADCLEKAVPDTVKDDPLCPQCVQIETAALKAFSLRFDRVKHKIEPLKKQLGRLFKAKSCKLAVKADEDLPSLPRSLSGRRKGVLLRSLSKLQAPLQVKVMKAPGSHVSISR
eukprot:c10440_g1_i1 orf=772-1872(+)